MAKKDYYKLFNIAHTASLKEIKSAYRQLALKYHPDHNPNNPEALAKFSEVQEAYEVLTTKEQREAYDKSYSPSPSRPPRAEPESRPKTESKPDSNSRSKNLRYNLFINLEDVAKGCERTIRYIRTNNGEKETLQLKVKVPKGAYHQQRLKLSGYGDITPQKAGDLFVIVHIQNHPIFVRQELNLRVNVPITYLDAALGSSIEVPTLSGIRKIKLKSCEFNDLDFTLRGFGLPDIKGHHKGDLLIHCFIENPEKLTTNERNALQKSLKTWPQGELMQQYKINLNKIKGS